jgi:ubiquinone/menaquinone biosynthesis C-methylase UbiE
MDRGIMLCVLHHLMDPESALKELRRVTKSAGVVSIYLPCDPGMFYMLAQRLALLRKTKRLLVSDGLSGTAAYHRALEHPGHYRALRALVLETFKDKHIDEANVPFGLNLPDFNLFSIFHVRM